MRSVVVGLALGFYCVANLILNNVQMCNSDVFQILSWPAIWACCREVVQWKGEEALNEVDLSDEAMPTEDWVNTVTTYSRGCVIIRLSWQEKKPVVWTDETKKQAVNACAAICLLLRNCC